MDPAKTGVLIARLRKEKNLTQEALAQKLGVTRKAISRWETGRGYPDIEILPQLAEILSVSVNEILSGEVLPSDPVIDDVRPKGARRRWIVVLAACVAGLVIPLWIWMAVGVADSAKGSANCVIAEDYSSITYCGEIYVPLDTGGYQCRIGRELVSEASVENLPLVVKLFFGDSVHEVTGTADGALLYLQTDYDLAPSYYYVRESQLVEMEQILTDFIDAQIYAVITQKDWNEREILLEEGLLQISEEPVQGRAFDRSQGDVEIPVHIYEPNHIFYWTPGEIRYQDGEYYWNDAGGDLYPIDDACDAELDQLRSYMYQ